MTRGGDRDGDDVKEASETGRDRRMDPEEVRERLERWIEEVLAVEPPPEGIDGELMREILEDGAQQDTDLRSLWAAVTALTQEVKLQSRSFDRLAESLASVGRLTNSVEATIEAGRVEERARRPDGDESALRVLMDVRDRLERGAAIAGECLGRAREGGRLRTIAGGGLEDLLQTVEALATGYEMASERVDQALGTYGVGIMRCEGRTFDPECMSAVAVEHDADAPDGTVLQVVRPGYEKDGEVLRFAEVRVARDVRSGSRQDKGMLAKVMQRLKRTLGADARYGSKRS